MARRIIDLTLPIHQGMTTFKTYWHPAVEISVLGRHETENRETRKIILGTHTGTHADAPRHFIPGGKTVDNLSLDVLIGPAFVLDFSQAKPNQQMEIDDFKKQLGRRRYKRLVLRFDWSDHFNKDDYYTGLPFISQASASWLVDYGVKLLAMDTPMPDNPTHGRGTGLDSPVHKTLLGNGVVLVEYLCKLKELKKQEIELIVLPLKILDADGSPARCVAIES